MRGEVKKIHAEAPFGVSKISSHNLGNGFYISSRGKDNKIKVRMERKEIEKNQKELVGNQECKEVGRNGLKWPNEALVLMAF